MTLLDQIPGLRDAVEKEQFIRDTAFLDIPEQICGIEVKPLTIRHVLALSLVGSPFMVGGNPSPVDCAQFLWCASTRWDPSSKLRQRLFLRRCRSLDYILTSLQIQEFVEESFQDAPPSSGTAQKQSYVSFTAGIVDLIAHEYGWSPATIMDMPLKQVFQLITLIRKRHNPNTVLFNPSDKVRGRWLNEVNTKNL